MTFPVLPISDSRLTHVAVTHAKFDLAGYGARLVAAGHAGRDGYAGVELPAEANLPKMEADASRGLLTGALDAARAIYGEQGRCPSDGCPRFALIHALLFFADAADSSLKKQAGKLYGGADGFMPWTAEQWATQARAYADRLSGEGLDADTLGKRRGAKP
jgi:hypothetical protein